MSNVQVGRLSREEYHVCTVLREVGFVESSAAKKNHPAIAAHPLADNAIISSTHGPDERRSFEYYFFLVALIVVSGSEMN